MKPRVQEEAIQSFGMLNRIVRGDFAKNMPQPLRDKGAKLASVGHGHDAIPTLVRNARLLAMDFERFHDLWKPIQKEVVGDIADAVFERLKDERSITTAQVKEMGMEHQHEMYMRVIEQYEWEPLTLPFDCVYVAFHNINEQHERVASIYQQVVDTNSDRFKPIYLISVGYLLAPNFVYNLVYSVSDVDGQQQVGYELYPIVEEGVLSILDRPTEIVNLLTIVELTKAIADTGVTRISRASMEHRKLERYGKRVQHTPKDYHVIDVENHVSRRTLPAEDHSDRAPTHEHDVMAHNVTWIMRGSLPMSQKTERYLRRDERRRIFTSPADVDMETRGLFFKRGIWMRDDEWISVLTVRRKAHTRGQGRLVPALYNLDTVEL